MPHEKPYLNQDPIKRKESELLAQREKEAEIFRIQNAAMRNRLLCGVSDSECVACESPFEECKKTWREQNKLWGITDREALSELEAVLVVGNARKTGSAASFTLHAEYQSAAKRKSSDHPGDPAFGSSLFDLDKAA